jgi:hypothetical protein
MSIQCKSNNEYNNSYIWLSFQYLLWEKCLIKKKKSEKPL